MEIYLGPAGSPAKSTIEGLAAVREFGLQAMEVEFTHGIKMGLPLAEQIGKENEKHNIKLSIHAPYFINLASEEKSKVVASKKRILDSCERANLLGAEVVVFHPSYYGKNSREEIYRVVREEILDMMKTIRKNKWNVQLAPETTGKISQFGTLDEIIKLVKDIHCSFCLDCAHIYARDHGKIDYREIFNKLKPLKLKNLHCHFSNITYTLKGERMHLNLDSKPEFKGFAKEILKRKINTTIISESPITWRDSLKMKKIFERLGYKF